MTAVRLAAVELKLTDKPLPDLESPSKQEFHRMLKHNGFLKEGFLPLLQQGALDETFKLLTTLLHYKGEKDTGLPKHAFPLLHRPLVQVLLRWVRLIQLQHAEDVSSVLEQSRVEVLRFVMYWQLCIIDPKKASKLAFEKLVEPGKDFPGKTIYKHLLNKEVAIPILAPETLTDAGDYVFSNPTAKLRGWKRFEIKPDVADDVKKVVALYLRWWNKGDGHVHPILLWLQREIVDTFDGSPVAGRDEETPYDYDHICPANHWSGWTGVTKKNKITDFCEHSSDKQGHWRVGNCIGNLRVWNSSDNRSLGNASPREKLRLEEDADECAKLLKQSAIDKSQIDNWIKCSGEKGNGRHWDDARTKAFQSAVESRAFSLYKNYFYDLDFAAWLTEISE
jgi:hypothetical protein